MPISKFIIKRVRQQAVVKFVGDGTANVDLVADLKLPDETVTDVANTVRVNINSVIFTNSNSTTPITIARNGNTVMQLFGNDNWSFNQMMGFVDNENNGANIKVTLPATSTLFLGLTKQGFNEPNNQALKDYQKI
jgi:hypothetical protein